MGDGLKFNAVPTTVLTAAFIAFQQSDECRNGLLFLWELVPELYIN